MPLIPGRTQIISLKNVHMDKLSETIRSIYFTDIVIQAIKITIGETIRNVVNSLLKMYLKAIENIALKDHSSLVSVSSEDSVIAEIEVIFSPSFNLKRITP